MSETIVYTPENQANNALPWMLAGQNNGGFLGNNGLGGGILGFLLGLWLGNGNFGGIGGGNNANANAQREMLNNAIFSQGEASRTAVNNLATMLGQDFNLVNSGVSALRDGIAGLTAQTGMSALQIQNTIQSGNAALASQLCDCCCKTQQNIISQGYENQIATLNQTNTLAGAITGGNQRVVDAIADLKTTTIGEFCAARERDMQADIDRKAETITQLRGQIDNANQTAAITGYINSLVSPLAKEVDDIKCKLPNTVSVTYPNLYAVNATPYVSGGYYQGGYNGLYGGGVPGFGGIGGGIYF